MPLATKLWTLVGLSNFNESAPTDNFSILWRLVMISEISPFHILQCICLLWRIWKSINKVTFQLYQPHVRALVIQFYNQVLEVSFFAPSSTPKLLLPFPPSATWEPPPDDYLKIYFDAVVHDSGCSSVLVIRGSDGHEMLAAGMRHRGIVNLYTGELPATRDDITIIASRSLTHMIVEGDLGVVVN
ncbi:unnamed protein product [Linum trigynum]|uniref:Uncharacterized protein n=1 Tax=Linum trigynum TaxID=586398 RepID=A0AAV2CJ57_9ROSI